MVTLIVAIGYATWVFAPFLLAPSHWLAVTTEWAIKLPVIILVYAFLFIVGWIGYTMATTPVPKPLEKPLEVETTKEEAKEEKEEKPKKKA